MADFKIVWVDSGREPQCPPNPAYPFGMDVNELGLPAAFFAASLKTCKTDLPYPARRCGRYVVNCRTCGKSVVVTTAGRPDDPRSLTVLCKQTVQ